MKKVYLFALVFATISLLFAQNLKYKVNEKSCISCTLCVSKCPVKAIEMKNNKAVIDPAKCIGCGLCVPACPVKAIDKDQLERLLLQMSLKQFSMLMLKAVSVAKSVLQNVLLML